MAVVVPLAAAAFSVSAGVALGATIAGYAMVAGGILSGVGALTGKKDLMKAGGILSLAGGLGSALSGAGTGANTVVGGPLGSSAGSSAAAAGSVESLYGKGAEAAGTGYNFSGGLVADAATDAAAASGSFGASYGGTAGGALGNTLGDAASSGGWLMPAISGPSSAVQQAASSMTSNDIGSFLQKAASKVGTGLKEIGPWVKNNKELLQIGTNVISGMYGPEAEMAELAKDKMNYERGLMDRAYKNMNSPVKLYNYARGG